MASNVKTATFSAAVLALTPRSYGSSASDYRQLTDADRTKLVPVAFVAGADAYLAVAETLRGLDNPVAKSSRRTAIRMALELRNNGLRYDAAAIADAKRAVAESARVAKTAAVAAKLSPAARAALIAKLGGKTA